MNFLRIINQNFQNHRLIQVPLLKRGFTFSQKAFCSTKIEENLVYEKENFYLTQSFAVIGISSVMPVFMPQVEYIPIFGLAWATGVRFLKLNQSYMSLIRRVMTKYIITKSKKSYY